MPHVISKIGQIPTEFHALFLKILALAIFLVHHLHLSTCLLVRVGHHHHSGMSCFIFHKKKTFNSTFIVQSRQKFCEFAHILTNIG